jgi:hypothetical protein
MGLEGRAGGFFDVILGAVALLESITEHRTEIFTSGRQNGPVAVDTLLLHHKAYVVKGAALEKEASDVLRIQRRTGIGAAVEEHERWSHTLRGHTANAMVAFARVSHNNVSILIHSNCVWVIELSQ